MDLEQINMLSNDAKGKYMALMRLFDQPGFKYLVEWAKAQVIDCTSRELNAPNWDIALLSRGARMAYTNFVEIEKLTESEFSAAADEAKAALDLIQEEEAEASAIDNE